MNVLRIASKSNSAENRLQMEINFDKKLISIGPYVFTGSPHIKLNKKEIHELSLMLKENGFLIF